MMNHFGTTDSNSVASTNQSVCNEQPTSTNDQQLHLMINIEQPSGQTFHQNYLPAQVIEEHDTFVQQSTDATVATSSGNDPFGYYYDSTTAQLTPELSTSYQVDWNKVDFPISSAEIGHGENIQNEWSFHQETHQQPAQAQSIVSGGSGTIKISGDIFAGGVPNTFNQFDQTAASGQSIDSDQLLNNTPSPINASVQSATVPITTTVASLEQKGKKSGKRNQKNSGPNGQNGKGESRQTKPVSAYALFFRDTQSSIKTDNPSASFGEISKIVASKWELLRKEDKDVYKERADLEKRNYLQNLASNKAKEIASTCSNESNSPHQMNFIMTNSAELTGTPPPVLATEIVYGQSAETGMDMLQQVSSSDVDSAATLNSYTTFDFNQPSSTQFHSGLNPVMSQTFDLGHQFDDDKVSPSFVFNDEASFFDTATESMIDLGIDLNDFDDINMLNEDIYSSNSGSVFDSTTVNPYMNQSQTVSGNEEPYTSGGTMLSAQPINGATNLYQCSVNDELRIPASIGHDYAENNNYVQDCSGSDQPESSLVMNGGQVETMNSRSAGLEVCARSGCQRQPVDSSEWDTEFCSEECCVRYCADVFRAWTSNKAFKPDPDSVQALTSS